MPHDSPDRDRERGLRGRCHRTRCKEGSRLETKENPMKTNRIVSRGEWLTARVRHLANEKELTRQRDALASERRELPWVRVEKRYEFDGPNGRETLADLFDGHSQLVIYHFMFGPDWQEGCPSCSFVSDTSTAREPTWLLATSRW